MYDKRIILLFVILILVFVCNQDMIIEEVVEENANKTIGVEIDEESDEMVENEIIDEDSFHVDINDVETMVVEIKAIPMLEGKTSEMSFLYDSQIEIKIYDPMDESYKPQIFIEEVQGSLFKNHEIVDANFDGYKDFGIMQYLGNVNYNNIYFIWNQDLKQFEFSSELSHLSIPQFDSEKEIVESFNRDSAASNVTKYYKYFNNNLICVRILDMGYPSDGDTQILTVKDNVNGEMVVVYEKLAKFDLENGGFYGEVYDEFFKWHDIEYMGK